MAVFVNSGGDDAQGSQRGLEYDTVSGLFAEFLDSELLPYVESQVGIKLTKDPEGRATLGGSSGGSCAFSCAWFRPDLFRRVLCYSGTFVNQQSPYNSGTPTGCWVSAHPQTQTATFKSCLYPSLIKPSLKITHN